MSKPALAHVPRCLPCALLACVACLCPRAARGALVSVLTQHNDNARTGANTQETILTPANVGGGSFGRLFTNAVDGKLWGQPLIVPQLAMGSSGVHNVVFVATGHDSVYAFDADAAGPPLWHVSFIAPANGITTMPNSDTGNSSIAPEVGITGTPVIDPVTNTMYLVAATKEVSGGSTRFFQRLHALDITTGQERSGSPVEIIATVNGTGAGSAGGTVTFNPVWEAQRASLLLSKGVVYITWASHYDANAYHGWVLGYDAATLQRVRVFNDTPNGEMGGIWQSGGGLAADADGYVYAAIGNGTFDITEPRLNYGDSFVKLSPTDLSVAGFFTPYNQLLLASQDLDLGCGAPVLLPDQPAAPTHLAVFGGKNSVVYVIDRDNMGGFHSAGNNIVQEIPPGQAGQAFSSPAYFNGSVYFGFNTNWLSRYSVSNGRLSQSPVSRSSVHFGYPGPTPVISANGTANAIAWAVDLSVNPAVLYAFDATDLTKMLCSSHNVAADSPGAPNKFTTITVANGKVYVGAGNGLSVYGLTGKPAYTLAEALKAIAVAGGPATGGAAEITRLAIAGGQAGIDITDAVAVWRKVAGLDSNP